MGIQKTLFSGLIIFVISTLFACSAGIKSIKKLFHETSVIEMTIKASDDLNPNEKDRPSPLVVYIYELSDGAPFDEADFFAIYDNEAETIGPVLRGKQEITLAPGETHKIKRTLKADTRHLGILAAYRDIDNAKWRASMPMPEHSKIELTLKLDQLSIKLTED